MEQNVETPGSDGIHNTSERLVLRVESHLLYRERRKDKEWRNECKFVDGGEDELRRIITQLKGH